MFDIGWTELVVIACVAIIVVGPKDLPRMLRTLGQMIGKARRLSREFQSTFNDAIREAEKQADIADMKKQVEAAANFNPLGDLKKSIEEDKKPATQGSSDNTTAETADAEKPATPPSAPPESGLQSKVKVEAAAEPATSAADVAAEVETSEAKQGEAEEKKA